MNTTDSPKFGSPARRFRTALAIAVLSAVLSASSSRAADFEVPRPGDGPNVVLLHGLIRTGRSMTTLGKALSEAGYRVCNVTYPSRHHSIEVLASQYVAPAIARCFPDNAAPIAFVTHSMGGIIVRQLAALHAVPSLGRVVMLGPPNAGSELVDEFGDWWLFRAINGPAALELGTTTDSTPRRLGPATFEVGIIAGTRSRNLVWSRYFDERNDGKVSVASAALVGMKDFLEIDENHTFIMRNREAIDQTLRFLKDGTFTRNVIARSLVTAGDEAPMAVPPQARSPAAVKPATGALIVTAPAS